MSIQQADTVGILGPGAQPATEPRRQESQETGVVRRRGLLRRVPIWLCYAWLATVLVCAVFAELLPVDDPEAIDPINRLQGPSWAHLFGTDTLGRDLLSRVVYGARVSVVVAVASLALGLTIGGALGIVAGYMRGKIDGIASWTVDVVLSFPALVLLIALVAYTGGGLMNISLALGFLAIPAYARIARAHTMAISSEEFVLAARASGATRTRVLWREVLPNVLPALLAYGLIAMSLVIVIEGNLSFLGLSVSAPTPSWGGLIADGQNYIRDSPTNVIIPATVLCITVLALNVAGEQLRRRFEVGGNGD